MTQSDGISTSTLWKMSQRILNCCKCAWPDNCLRSTIILLAPYSSSSLSSAPYNPDKLVRYLFEIAACRCLSSKNAREKEVLNFATLCAHPDMCGNDRLRHPFAGGVTYCRLYVVARKSLPTLYRCISPNTLRFFPVGSNHGALFFPFWYLMVFAGQKETHSCIGSRD